MTLHEAHQPPSARRQFRVVETRNWRGKPVFEVHVFGHEDALNPAAEGAPLLTWAGRHWRGRTLMRAAAVAYELNRQERIRSFLRKRVENTK